MLVLHPRFPIVTFDTKGLPVPLIPEEVLVTSMRENMINSYGLGQLTLLHAVNT
jgi:hypothetical protein